MRRPVLAAFLCLAARAAFAIPGGFTRASNSSSAATCNTSGGDLTGACASQTIGAAAVTDSKVNLTTGAIASGKFGDNRVAVDSGAITGYGPATVSTLTAVGNAFSVGLTTFAVTGGRVGIGTSAPTAALDLNSQKIANVLDPVSAQDAATKNYVDTSTTSKVLPTKVPARWATTAALPANSYSNGSSGVGATLTGLALGAFTVDGQTPLTNDRLLVKNEATAANNGIYIVTTNGAGVFYVLTRANDFDTASEMGAGEALFVTSGTTNADGFFVLLASVTTVGTDPINFSQANGLGDVTTTAALTKSGNTIGVDSSSVAVKSGGLVLNTDIDASSVTKQGNNFNAASQLAKLNSNTNLALTYGFSAATGSFSSGVTVSTLTATGANFSVGASTLVVSGGNVGLGTSAPIYPADVSGTLRATNASVTGNITSSSASVVGAGGVLVTYGVSAATGSFTATGATTYSVTTSSGIKMQNNGCLQFGDASNQCTASTGGGLAAGTNANITSTWTFSGGLAFSTPTIAISSGARFPGFTQFTSSAIIAATGVSSITFISTCSAFQITHVFTPVNNISSITMTMDDESVANYDWGLLDAQNNASLGAASDSSWRVAYGGLNTGSGGNWVVKMWCQSQLPMVNNGARSCFWSWTHNDSAGNWRSVFGSGHKTAGGVNGAFWLIRFKATNATFTGSYYLSCWNAPEINYPNP